MPPEKKKRSIGKKFILILLLFIVLLVVAYRIFITRYLPPLIRDRLNTIIVSGSDSLYKFELGKINPGFWGNSFRFTEFHIYIDSAVYKQLKEVKRLPGMTIDLSLPAGQILNIGLPALLLRKKLNIRLIDLAKASIQLSRHFRNSDNNDAKPPEPLWKSIQKSLQSVNVEHIAFRDIKIKYSNIDSAASFSWEFDKCYAAFSGLRIDSASAFDSTRLLYSKDIAINAQDVKLKTPDGLYAISANQIFYTSQKRQLEVKDFGFNQAVDNQAFVKHFGFQHEIYQLAVPSMRLTNFLLPYYINYNQLNIDTIALQSPDIGVYLDRNPPPNPYSKLGKYPHQLIQRAPFLVRVKRVTATNGKFTYREKNNRNQLTGKLVFPGIQATVDHITNDSVELRKSATCVVNVRSGLLETGVMNAVFRFNLMDRSGGFSVAATITNLSAPQMKPLIKAMTSAEMQSFNLHRLDFVMSANEISGVGQLRMKYGDMDILLNKVDEDGKLNQKGLLSFFVNHLVIYKENPTNDGEERIATDVPMNRVANKSFFNFIWKTLYTSAGKIVLRPVVQRKMEKRKEKKAMKAERQKEKEKKK